METKTTIVTSTEDKSSEEQEQLRQQQQLILQQQVTPTNNSASPAPAPAPAPSSSPTKKQHSHRNQSGSSLEVILAYNGQTIISAASQGNLPVCVLLWGMASAKKINIMAPDVHGNNPMHYACLAQTSEVMGFFHQQLRGMLTPEIRLVDSINHAGETPLLRAMTTGQMAVIKALLDEKSNPLVSDKNGNNVLINAAKNCQLWCLNFMYDYIRNTHGPEAVYNLLHARDHEGWSAMEWSIEAGDINIVEYLIKKGLNPSHIVEKSQQNSLHIAVAHHRVDVACFLLDLGIDHTVKDVNGKTPLQHHALTQDPELKHEIMSHPRINSCRFQILGCCLGSDHVPLQNNSNLTGIQSSNRQADLESGLEVIPTSRVAKDGMKRSYAIKRLSPTRLSYLMMYAVVTCGVWLLSMVVPFYAYIPLVGIGGGGYSYLAMQVGTLQSRAMHAKGRLLLSWWQQIIGAPEKYIGFWLGNILAFSYFYLSAIAYASSRNSDDDEETDDHSAFQDRSRNPTQIAGLNCALKDPLLFWWTLVFLFITLVSWTMIVFIFPDPGIVDTRDRDFFEVMDQSLQEGGGPPNATAYCRTTLVKKPLRSKYCASSGYVVARMDHYCVWLNSAVGYGNHRTFIVFLYSHYIMCILCLATLIRILQRDTSVAAPSYVTGELLSQRMLFITSMTLFIIIITCGLTLLVGEQTVNIFSNMTTNEKVNRSRYWWMKGPDGRPMNRFDRGPLINFLEFIGCPCYHVNYMTIMTIEESGTAIDSNKSDHSADTRATELMAQTGTSPSPSRSPLSQQQQKGGDAGSRADVTSNPLNEHSHDPHCQHHE